MHDRANLVISQMVYLDKKGKETNKISTGTKLEVNRVLTDEKQSTHRTDAGLAWVGNGTSTTSAYLANMELQGKRKTVALLNSCRETYKKIPEEQLALLRYVPLDFVTIHIRIFSDESLQNLPEKFRKSDSSSR